MSWIACGYYEIDEGAESKLFVQLTTDLGLPREFMHADSILWKLHDEEGNIINGRNQVEVLEQNGGTFIGTHAVASMSVVRGVVDVVFTEPHSLQSGLVLVLRDIVPGARDPNGKAYVVEVLTDLSVRLPSADGRDFDSLGDVPEAIVGMFTLELSAEDNAIIEPVSVDGRQKRWALLELFADGQRIATPELAYWVIDREGAT